MIRMSRLTDYGIVLMTHVVRHSEKESHTARGLATETHLPLPTVSKLLKVLTRKGFLASQRGVHGGYRLAVSPDEVSVAQLIRALEGPVQLINCASGEGECDQEATCPSKSHLQLINQTVRSALEKIALSKMARPALPPIPFIPFAK